MCTAWYSCGFSCPLLKVLLVAAFGTRRTVGSEKSRTLLARPFREPHLYVAELHEPLRADSGFVVTQVERRFPEREPGHPDAI